MEQKENKKKRVNMWHWNQPEQGMSIEDCEQLVDEFRRILLFLLYKFSYALPLFGVYTHHISPALSKINTSFKNAIAFSRPSVGDISASSCSMLITPS